MSVVHSYIGRDDFFEEKSGNALIFYSSAFVHINAFMNELWYMGFC